MTEEEQLQVAIRASMNDVGGGMNNNINDDDDDQSENDSYMMEDSDDDGDDGDNSNGALDTTMDMGDDDDVAVELEAVTEVTFHDEVVAMDVGDEVSGNDGVARIMIRMPDGKRLVRKFKLDDIVKIIYAVVAVSMSIMCLLEKTDLYHS